MSKKMPWLRLYTEIIDDDKLGLLAFEDRWHYIAILCCKRRGILDADCAPELLRRRVALKLGLAVRELDEVVRRLSEVELIDRETMQPNGWNARQFDSDTDTTAAERKRRQRAREKADRAVTDASRVTVTDVTRTDTDTDTDTDTEQKQKQTPSPAATALPEWVDPDAWAGFAEMRKRIRAPLTKRAIELTLRELDKLRATNDPNEVLDQSTQNGWRGVFAIKTERGANHAGHRESAAERVRRLAIEGERRDRAAAGVHGG